MSYHALSRWLGATFVLLALLLASFIHVHAAGVTNQQPDVGNAGQLVLTKTVQTSGQPVKPGALVTYTLDLSHEGGVLPIETVISDVLPIGVRLAGPVNIREVTPNVGPLLVRFRERAVAWRGHLSPGAKLEITFPARVGFCLPSETAAGTATRHNVATARQVDGSLLSAVADVTVDCTDPLASVVVTQTITPASNDNPDAPATVEAAAADDASINPDVIDVFPGETMHQQIQVTNKGIIAILIGLVTRQKVETVQGGVGQGYFGAPAFFSVALQPGETKRIDRAFIIDADLKPETIIVQQLGYCAPDEDTPACPDPQDDQTGFLHFAKPVRMALRFRDLGDAPDSTNHFTKTMEAYPDVKALFPTVFDPATGAEQGPMHIFPRPFHLGAFVSQEVDADRGPDMDGIHNILPRFDRANLDRFDDGILPRALTFADCQTTTIPVQVFVGPHAADLLAQYGHKGYINIWVDSNRDGDWADAVQCPAPVGGVPGVALEHIVIDYPVDVTALGPGLHVVNVPTRLVSWPAKFNDKRAWLRVTLSERVSNKPLTAGGIAYGDGRGYADPFAFGETEDYVANARDLVNGADMVIHKEGVANQDFESAPGFDVGETVWFIRYHNQGLDVAHNVVITDVLPAAIPVDDPSLQVRTIPPIPFTRNGNTLIFKRGDVDSAQGGAILIRVHFRKPVAELQTITNTVVVGSANDGDVSNNQAAAGVKLGLRTPLITYPGNGTTCKTTFETRGRAIPGSEVDLYVDNALAATLLADPTDGHWTHLVTLAAGTHTFFTVARKNGISSEPSETLSVIVDPALTYDPLSVRFVDENGNVRRPVDKTGRTDAEGWNIHLRANTNYTVTLQLCCSDPASAVVSMTVPSVGVVNLTYNANRDRFVGHFKTGASAQNPTAQPIALSVTCNGEQRTFDGKVLIDPEGVVYDLTSRQPLSGANVSLEATTTNAANDSFTLWPASDYEQVNPQSTQTDGHFSFWTPAGTYRLNVNHAGYQPYNSLNIDVVDQPVHQDVWLTPVLADATTQVIGISAAGFSPAVVTVKPGAVIEWVNLDTSNHTATSDDLVQSAASNAATSWDSGLLDAGASYKYRLNAEGVFTYVDQTNPANTATLIVSNSAGGDSGSTAVYLPIIQK
ncbi:MAG: carboxypeptidase regulatory-like domain-containing protein [Caldilineaceae bacterium]